jgi:hypothetical protein
MQLYLHDFSEYAPLGTNYGEVNEEGRSTILGSIPTGRNQDECRF